MGFRDLFREFCYSLIIHSGLRNWRLVHWSRSCVAGVVAPGDFRSAREELVSDPAVSNEEKELLGRISPRIHRNDEMYIPFEARQYLSVGLSAVRCIDAALQKQDGTRPVESILDLPCGYGEGPPVFAGPISGR